MTEDDVAGTVEVVDEDGTFELPDRYFEADAIVYRDPSKTVEFDKGAPKPIMWFDARGDHNPHLSPDKVSVKIHGEPAEVFRVLHADRVEYPDDEDVGTTDTP